MLRELSQNCIGEPRGGKPLLALDLVNGLRNDESGLGGILHYELVSGDQKLLPEPPRGLLLKRNGIDREIEPSFPPERPRADFKKPAARRSGQPARRGPDA